MSAVLSVDPSAPDIDEGYSFALSPDEDALISASLAYALWWDGLSVEEQGRLPRVLARECFVAGYLRRHYAPEGGAA